MQATATPARQVFISAATPEDTLANAQVVIVTETTWHVLGRMKGRIDRAFMPTLPTVTCPIVDISALSEDYDRDVNNIYHAHVGMGGVNHVDVLIAELEKLGAVVKNVNTEDAELAAWQKEWEDTYETLRADMRPF